MDVHRVSDVKAAIKLAESFKRDGVHDWFRGQVCNFPLVSSLHRLDEAHREEALAKMDRFVGWVKVTPGLEVFADDIDKTFAVAQHYGLPSPFIDFTTEPQVAGFFASYGNPHEQRESCILCLNTSDLSEFWKVWMPEWREPEPLRLEVPDLWRLQAQRGTFLWCPYVDFEHTYDLDRIIFPFFGLVSAPRIEDMYPRRKSYLELLLDQFFMNETLIEGARKLASMNLSVRTVSIEWRDHNPELIDGKSLFKDNSWKPIKLSSWNRPPVENFSDAITNEDWTLQLDDIDPKSVSEKIAIDVMNRLSTGQRLRNKLVSWSVLFPKHFESGSLCPDLSDSLERLWDGLRNLPYDNKDIAIGIGNCVSLYLCRVRTPPGRDPWLNAASECLGEAIEIEFGASDASYSRGYASISKLYDAVREDIERYFTPLHRSQLVGNVTGMLQAVTAPDKLFNFDRLAKLFAREIAPSQVLVRFAGDSKRKSNPVFFSPAPLDKFGLP
jgi:FRG domain